MRIATIQNIQYHNSTLFNNNAKANSSVRIKKNNNQLNLYPLHSFTFGIANSSKLKQMFTYGVPCMYSGIEMIDPRKVNKLIRNGVFEQNSEVAINVLSQFKKSLTGFELRIYNLLENASKNTPTKTLSELLQGLSPIFERRLKKKQLPILKKISEMSQELPEEYKYKLQLFMDNSYKKINKIPVLEPFSTTDFQYKLLKIEEGIKNTENIKAQKVIKKMILEAQNLAPHTSNKTTEHQKSVISFLEIILKKSVLKNSLQLNQLINNAKQCLNKEKVLIPFSRKTFIYDLGKIIESSPNTKLQDKINLLARSLPTSSENISAYIVKIAKEPNEKIAYRLLWPSMASIEHIDPKSCGGNDALNNYGGACTRENSERQNIPFIAQLMRKPETRKNCQKYVDRLIELANAGIFKKINFSVKYIYDFKNVIKSQSQGIINLDLSKLKAY